MLQRYTCRVANVILVQIRRLVSFSQLSLLSEDILKHMITVKFKEIVKCLTERRLVEGIVTVFKERQILKQQVDTLDVKFNNDEEKIIFNLIELVMDDGLLSMLHFVNALIIVGAVEYEKVLLRTPDQNDETIRIGEDFYCMSMN